MDLLRPAHRARARYVGKTPRELNKMMGIARSTPISSMQDHGGHRKLSFLEQGQRVPRRGRGRAGLQPLAMGLRSSFKTPCAPVRIYHDEDRYKFKAP